MKYLGVLMALVYVAIGFAVIFTPNHLFNMQTKYALPLAGVFIAYGIFRGYNTYQKYREQ